MKEIKLGNTGYVAIVDDDEYGRLNLYPWTKLRKDNCIYPIRQPYVNGKRIRILMHQMLLEKKDGFIVDHQDCNGLNNLKSNLRYATYSQNSINKRKMKNTSSRFKGVCFRKDMNKWQVSLGSKKQGRKHLGFYSDEIEAAKKYDSEAIKYYGEFARLNFQP